MIMKARLPDRACDQDKAIKVGKEGVEPSRPYGHTDLNRARLPFRHFPERSASEARGTIPRPRGHRLGLSVAQRTPSRTWCANGIGCRLAPRKSSTCWPVGVHTTVRRPDTIMASEPEEEPVSVLQRFEKRLEGLVEGAFAKVFKGVVHPVEILNAMQRA